MGGVVTRASGRVTIVVLVLALAVGPSACGGGSGPKAHPAVTTTAAAGRPDTSCRVTSVATAVRHLASPAGSVWVWIESAARPSYRVGSLIKVVWRITGSGAPRLTVTAPGGGTAR